MYFLNLALVSIASIVAVGPSHGFDRGIAFIDSQVGQSTGFVVATNPNQRSFEVWTNGHCVGPVGSSCSVTIRKGTGNEYSTTGTVQYRATTEGYDAAKIIAKGFYSDHVWPVCNQSWSRNGNYTVGFPNGRRSYAYRIDDLPGLDYASVLACIPAPEVGQSGGPVVNSEGEVVGVMSLYFKRRGDARRYGGYLPISQWSEPSTERAPGTRRQRAPGTRRQRAPGTCSPELCPG